MQTGNGKGQGTNLDAGFEWLNEWYRRQCDGDWEHQYGIQMETLDNPGWSIEIDLAETELEARSFTTVQIERSEHDWVHLRIEGAKFLGYGGVGNLNEIVTAFRNWAESL